MEQKIKSSSLQQRILHSLLLGAKYTKYNAAKQLGCCERTAARHLKKLHQEKYIRICGWVRTFGGPVPRYKRQDGRPDSEPPASLTPLERVRRCRLLNSKLREREREYSRAYAAKKREDKKALSGKVRLGVWGI